MTPDPIALDDFSGTARLFPLPNLVLFPHVAQPLHLFERRYRQLMSDALAADRLIAMALLQSGWEQEYHLNPPIHPMVCVGRIHNEEQLADGRYNLLLQGLSRARVLEEIESDRLYRLARVELVADLPASKSEETTLRQQLAEGAMPFFATHPQAHQQFRQLLESQLPLGALCDIVGFALPYEVSVKQELLEELAVAARVRLLLSRAQGLTPPSSGSPRTFPPSFSEN